jgi:DNA-binding protein H-NS
VSNYRQILAEIEALKIKAEEMRRTEVVAVIADIKEKIRDYDLTAADLGLVPTLEAPQEPAKPAGKRGSVKPKYRDPASGKTWSGRGVMPKWMKAALDLGRTKEEFLIGEE